MMECCMGAKLTSATLQQALIITGEAMSVYF